MNEERVVDPGACEIKPFPKFGWKDKVGYAFGDLGCNLSFTLIAVYMADFYTQYIGISASIWAVIIVLTKVWDGINDPIMGGIMDSVKIGKGTSKFKPWIKIGAVGLLVTGALVFIPIPNAAMWIKVLVCIVSYLLWDISYTLLNVPYGALNNAISADPIERTQLSTWRSIGAGIGAIICMLLPILIYDKNDNLLGGRLIWIGLGLGVIAMLSYIACLKMTVERVPSAVESGQGDKKKKYNYFKTLKGFFKNRSLIAMCLASFALIVFFTSNASTTKWLFQAHFGNAGTALTIAGIASFAPVVILLPFVTKLVKRFGKKVCTAAPLFISVVTCVIMMCVPIPATVGGSIGYVCGLMLIQFGGGMFNLVCWAMITDCVDYQQLKTGRREEGSVYAMYSFFRKVAQGVALSLPLLCMTWVGFDPQANPIGDQAAGVTAKMVTMSIGLMLIGAVIMLIALLLIYNLGKKEVENMAEKLGRVKDGVDLNDAIANRNE